MKGQPIRPHLHSPVRVPLGLWNPAQGSSLKAAGTARLGGVRALGAVPGRRQPQWCNRSGKRPWPANFSVAGVRRGGGGGGRRGACTGRPHRGPGGPSLLLLGPALRQGHPGCEGLSGGRARLVLTRRDSGHPGQPLLAAASASQPGLETPVTGPSADPSRAGVLLGSRPGLAGAERRGAAPGPPPRSSGGGGGLRGAGRAGPPPPPP